MTKRLAIASVIVRMLATKMLSILDMVMGSMSRNALKIAEHSAPA